MQQHGACLPNKDGDVTQKTDKPVDIVITVAQVWSENYFHFMIEQMPRIAQFYDYLIAHPEIKIHVFEHSNPVKNILDYLGFVSERIVSGPIYAKTVFRPSPVKFCGNADFFQIAKLREILIKRLHHFFPNTTIEPRQKTIALIKRSSRVLHNHDELVTALQKEFPEYKIWMFRDDPLPSEPEAFLNFYQASYIIAPHGAGLAHFTIAEPGTVVIEYLSNGLINFCFSTTAASLGLKYYGMIADERSHHYGELYAGIEDTINIIRNHEATKI